MRLVLVLAGALSLAGVLAGCTSERHFAYDSVVFGNPNAPIAASETAQRALGHAPDVTPIAPQAGNVWPGPVQPVPTIADEEKAMNEPLGNTFAPSLPSPYPPGDEPPPNADLGIGPLGNPGTQNFATPSGVSPGSDLAPLTGPLVNPLGGQNGGVQSGTVTGPSSMGGATSGGSVGGSSGSGQ